MASFFFPSPGELVRFTESSWNSDHPYKTISVHCPDHREPVFTFLNQPKSGAPEKYEPSYDIPLDRAIALGMERWNAR